MPTNHPFQSPQHKAAFHHGGQLHERGGPAARNCGARLRTGAPCPNPPIKESKGRCLSHAGPKAANAHHESLRRGFVSGRISAEVWNQTEARRAANRLGDQWKNNPWKPGSTIDLGGHKSAFLDALGGVQVDDLPPAVLDWLGWRYRRTQIDRQDGAAWHKALTQDLPRRVTTAGPRPVDAPERVTRPGTTPLAWVVSADSTGIGRGAGYKRSLPDKPRAPRIQRGKGYARPGRPRTQPADADEFEGLMRVYRENVTALKSIMEAVQGEAKQLAVLRTLRDYLVRPEDVEACKRWLALVEQVQVR